MIIPMQEVQPLAEALADFLSLLRAKVATNMANARLERSRGNDTMMRLYLRQARGWSNDARSQLRTIRTLLDCPNASLQVPSRPAGA